MKKSRLTALLAVGALVTGLVGAWSASAYIEKRVNSERQALQADQVQVEVVVVSRDVQLGEVITMDMLALRSIPNAYVDEKALTEDYLEWILGKMAVAPISRGTPLLESFLKDAASLAVLTRIPEGMRAVAFSAANPEFVIGKLQAGDRIDIHFTFQDGARSKTAVLIANAMLIDMGGDPDSMVSSMHSVMTVALEPSDAARLIHAQSHGELRITARAANDAGAGFKDIVHAGNLLGRPVTTSYRRPVEWIIGAGVDQ